MTKIQKDNAWGAIMIIALIVCAGMCSRPSMAAKTDNFYSVVVELRVGNCTSRNTYTVKARSYFDAKDVAERTAQYSVTARAKTVKEIR